MNYEAHELSLAFPDMAPEQFRRLSEDVKRNGLIHPIVLLEGKILDGRHRHRACADNGVAPHYREFREGDQGESCKGDPVAFVHSENAARRQLSESQIAYAMTHPNILQFEQRKAKERQLAGKGEDGSGGRGHEKTLLSDDQKVSDAGRTCDKLAAKSGLGSATIQRAISVRNKGAPEVLKAVESGDLTITMASKIVKLNPSAQKRIVEAPAQARPHELRTAMNLHDAAMRRGNSKAPSTRLPEGPATPFVRKLLSGLERLAILCAEDGAKTGSDIAARFLDEMDWNAAPLTSQLERAEPIIRALAIIQQRSAKAA